jgi:hypothetical protein
VSLKLALCRSNYRCRANQIHIDEHIGDVGEPFTRFTTPPMSKRAQSSMIVLWTKEAPRPNPVIPSVRRGPSTPADAQRALAMWRNAQRALADITQRLDGVLADPRSVLDRPLLVDDHDPVNFAFIRARRDAHTTIARADTSQLGAAAEALAAAEAARYAFALADDHARALACRGIYPGGIVLDRPGRDHVAAPRASLELACQAGHPDVALAHQQRARDLVAAAGLLIPAP